jgi:hypothetical protein
MCFKKFMLIFKKKTTIKEMQIKMYECKYCKKKSESYVCNKYKCIRLYIHETNNFLNKKRDLYTF